MQREHLRHEMDNAYLTIQRRSTQGCANDSYINDEDAIHFPIQNVGRGGVRFCSNQHFELDERVLLALYINGELSHKARGRICYHDEDQQHNNYYGVSFLDNYLHLER